jgi:hypothetical protein
MQQNVMRSRLRMVDLADLADVADLVESGDWRGFSET